MDRKDGNEDSQPFFNLNSVTFDAIELDWLGALTIAERERGILAERFVNHLIQVRKLH